jgi:hypothetical protein
MLVNATEFNQLDRDLFLDTPYPGNPGMLTVKGASQHRQLGENLRQIYMDELGFLPSGYSPKVVDARSTQTEYSMHFVL